MRFKVGDCIVWSFSNDKCYEKILEINEKADYCKRLDLETNKILNGGAIWLSSEYTRLMTDEEKIELL